MMKRYSISDGVTFDSVGEEMVISHPNGNLYVLNETGCTIFVEALDHGDPNEITSVLVEKYDAPRDKAEIHTVECIQMLLDKKLIKDNRIVISA